MSAIPIASGYSVDNIGITANNNIIGFGSVLNLSINSTIINTIQL